MLTFQQLIMKLQNYWGGKGCALLQPYDMEMGAGTFHTATFLRAIGPEPWRAAYVQPSNQRDTAVVIVTKALGHRLTPRPRRHR